MRSDSRNTGGKTNSPASGSGSGSVYGEASGLRRSARSQISSSPGSVRKSQRLENRVLERGTPSSGKGSPSKKPSPTNKGSKKQNSNKGDSKTLEGSKKEKTLKEITTEEDNSEMTDKTLKEIVEEARGSSPNVGEKKRKWMSTRQFKAIFDPMNNKVSETKSKKRRLEFVIDNADSGIGVPSEGISEKCGNSVDSGIMKSEEGLPVKCYVHGDSGGNSNEGIQENTSEDEDRGIEEPVEEPLECSDGEEKEEDCATNINGEVNGSKVEKNDVNVLVGEVNGSEVEELTNQDIQSALNSPTDKVNGSRCSQEALRIGAFVAGEKGTHTNMKVIPSVSSACTMGSLSEGCTKCSNKPRLDHDSPKQEPCGCVSNSMSAANLISVSKDRGECSNARVEDDRKTNRSDSLVGDDKGSSVSCERAGKLLRCSGKACRRSYHPSCLRTREENAHIPIWYCSDCMQKRLALGVHIVSEGIESVLDAREVESSNSEGTLKEKQYFVKYKCLAHIHNCWVAETQLLHEAPELLIKRSKQDTTWNSEWVVPHRLLLRRPVIVDNQDAGFASKSHHEWLVKWRSLDYDHATWELEDSEFFTKPEFQQLMQEYEIRHNGAKSSSILGDNKIQEKIKISPVKHGRVLDTYRAESVNKLREFLQKSHNAVLFDDQDRTMKIINFISSTLSHVRRPFLIITPHESLSYWEAEFLRFTTSINVVVYSGNTDSRKIIRNLEFYGEDGELMLQVLLSNVEAISEDLEDIKGIEWEVIIVDDCQEHCILENSGCIKTLATNWKLLLLNTQLKDTMDKHINILSLLEPVGSSNNCHGLTNASNEDINVLKERLCSFIISPRFQEYWVPVEISNVQLEQYCSFMLSNSTVLRMYSKSDPIGSLHDILISMQKCCDHPYIVNPSLRKSLLPENPSQDDALDMGVKASGKLQLLDKLLSEFRNQGLKVVILFQSIGGSGKDNLEFLLDDLLTWRFGKDSFEHIAVGGQPWKKHAALSKFNMERDRSFLLLETRACLPSIKLSLVDSVIILNSDWNPLNDLRALQKIVIDSKLKPIKVFRFYCSCTVEEKALIMAKNDTILDSTAPINPSTKQTLLMWGSSYLFSRLDEFHYVKALNYRDNVALGSSFVTNVFQEIVSLVKNDRNIDPINYISEARLDGRYYLKNIFLFGEQRNQVEEGVSSHTYWMKLLEGKQPQWKYLSVSSERNRKRVDYSDDLSLPSDVQTDESVKKCKDSSHRQAEQHPEEVKDRNKELQGHPDTRFPAHDERSDLHDQKGLFEMLKPTVLRLCEFLMLKDEVKRLAERFLEYVLNNHKVTREPETILQAFQISVCWTAAEVVLEKKIDQRKSLNIAIEKMDFKCLEQEVDSVYSKLKLLMKIFLFRNLKTLKSNIDPPSAVDDGTSVPNKSCVNISIGCLENIGFDKSSFENKEKDSLGDVEKVKRICEKKIKKLKERQNDELIKFESVWQEKRAELEDNYKVESAVIRYSHAQSNAVVEKLKILQDDYAKKREDLGCQISNHRKEFEARQQEERDGEQKKIAQLSELLKPMTQDRQSENLPSVNPIQLQMAEHIECCIPVGEPADDTNQIDTVLVGKTTAPESGVDNGVSTSFCGVSAEQSMSLVSTSMEHQSADGIACQEVGDELCQRRDGVEEQVGPLPESCCTSHRGEMSLSEPDNSVPYDEGTTALPATEDSVAVAAVHSCGYDQNISASSGRLNNQPNEVETAVQNSCTQMQQQIPQPGVARASTVLVSHPNPVPVLTPTIYRAPASYYSDPLQNEFDRIRKQIGETMNAHEEMKIRLKSECDKEIEELVAQIRTKYYAKLEEAESSFSLKKNELELNQNMVMMNKFLADAFRSKCMDYKAGPQGGSKKGKSSSSIEFPFQLQPTTRPFSATASFSVAPPAGILNSTPPSLLGVHPFPTLSSSVQARPSLVRSSSGGFQHAMHETRAPRPHLQHSSVPLPYAMSSNNMQYSSVLPPQPPNNNLASSSSQSPAIRSSHGQSHQPETFAREPALSMSATELLMDIARRNDINLHLCENLPPCPDNMQGHESWDLSQFGRAVDVQQPTGDVVCLSDDD